MSEHFIDKKIREEKLKQLKAEAASVSGSRHEWLLTDVVDMQLGSALRKGGGVPGFES